MTPTAPRFYQSGGQLFADRRPVSLEWAEQKIFDWFLLARRHKRAALNGEDFERSMRLSNEYRRQAETLRGAVTEADRWQRASGPNAAEAYTQKVRQMLQRSVEQGERRG